MKRTEPLQIGAILDDMLRRVSADPATRRNYLQSIWPQIVGPQVAAYTRRVSLEGRLLHVYINSASLKEQLGYMRESLTTEFNTAAGESVIDNILIH